MSTDGPEADKGERVAQPQRLLRLFEINPAFGLGAFRRRIRLRHRDGVVQGVLDDNNHAMWMRLSHAGGVVTAIGGGFYRPPTTGCFTAPDVLGELVGTPVTISRAELFAGRRAMRNCTHMFDLTAFALPMAARPEGDRIWDAVVPDPQNNETVATLDLDGERLLEWHLRDTAVVPEDGGEPKTLFSGFALWAARAYSGDALEGATMLRMAAFTARARAHISDDRPWPLAQFPEREGACHAYSGPRIETAIHRPGIVRDFSIALEESPWPGIEGDPVGTVSL